jgi:hypothetical protein
MRNLQAWLKFKFPYICCPIGELAQLARALAWHARGRRFDSDILHALRPPSGGFFIESISP